MQSVVLRVIDRLDRLADLPFLAFKVVPKERDEYKREEQGTWTHELKWQRRALTDDPAWHFNRLVALCALWWLLALVPGALETLHFATSAIALSFAFGARLMREFGVLAGSALAQQQAAFTHPSF
jgi:hypothetical protein